MNSGDALSRAQVEAPELAPYLAGDDRADLRMPRCLDCGHLQWPPRPFCARCGGDQFQAERIEPTGELFSWTTTHRAPTPELAALVPYTVVIVSLDAPGHPRVLGRLRETNRTPDLALGQRLRGAREPREDGLGLLTWSIDD